jgi:hypothetical protein
MWHYIPRLILAGANGARFSLSISIYHFSAQNHDTNPNSNINASTFPTTNGRKFS